MYTNAKEVFDKAMPNRFDAAQAANDTTSYHFSITGGGGDYLVKIENGKLDIQGPQYAGPSDLKITVDEGSFLDLANGKEGIQLLFITGKLRVDGDLPTAMKLVKYFPYTKRGI